MARDDGGGGFGLGIDIRGGTATNALDCDCCGTGIFV